LSGKGNVNLENMQEVGNFFFWQQATGFKEQGVWVMGYGLWVMGYGLGKIVLHFVIFFILV